jgi:DNA polymerase-3 subunit delta
MAKEVTYEEIVRNLKNRIYAPVYFLMGEEDYYIDRIADYIIDTVLSETEKEFNLTVTYGADTDVANVINAAKRYPMMSEYQVVVVREAHRGAGFLPAEAPEIDHTGSMLQARQH